MGHSLGALHALRIPREAVAQRPPLDAEADCAIALPDLPAVRLDELDHAHLPTPRDCAQGGAECGGRPPLAVAGVQAHARAGPAVVSGGPPARGLCAIL